MRQVKGCGNLYPENLKPIRTTEIRDKRNVKKYEEEIKRQKDELLLKKLGFKRKEININ